MNKIFAFWDLLNEGRAVANPEFWKKAQSVGQPALATLLIGIVAALKGTKYEIPISDETLTYIAGGIFAAVNWVLTRITTTKDIRVVRFGDSKTVSATEAHESVEVQSVTEAPLGQQHTNVGANNIDQIFNERG